MMRAIQMSVACVAVLVATAGQVQGGFFFDVTFDGTSATIDPSSDPIFGTVVDQGDTFSLDIHSAGNDFWSVNEDDSFFLGATFSVTPSSSRVGNATTTFFLDNVQVTQLNEPGINQSAAHFGNQYFSVTSGLEFDQVVVDYEFLSGPSTTIITSPDVVHFNPFFRQSSIDYVEVTSVVPEPSSLALFGIVACVTGVGAARRRRRERQQEATA